MVNFCASPLLPIISYMRVESASSVRHEDVVIEYTKLLQPSRGSFDALPVLRLVVATDSLSSFTTSRPATCYFQLLYSIPSFIFISVTLIVAEVIEPSSKQTSSVFLTTSPPRHDSHCTSPPQSLHINESYHGS